MKALFEDPDPKAVDLEQARHGCSQAQGRVSAPSYVHRSAVDDDNDEFAFWRYRDLVARRIVSDRTDLFRKQQRGFPRSVKFSQGLGAVALFRVAEVQAVGSPRTWGRPNPTMTAACATVGANSSIQRRRSRRPSRSKRARPSWGGERPARAMADAPMWTSEAATATTVGPKQPHTRLVAGEHQRRAGRSITGGDIVGNCDRAGRSGLARAKSAH